MIESNEVVQNISYEGVWRITDTVTAGHGTGQIFTFDILMYQSGDRLLGIGEDIILEGPVTGNRIQMTFFQLTLGYEGSFDWTMTSANNGSGIFTSSVPNSGISLIQRLQ